MERRDATKPEPDAIELRLRDVSQLFNTLDPFPFREKDVDPEAERFIVEWAEDLPKRAPIHIVVHLQNGTADERTRSDIESAITSWFAVKANSETKDMRMLFRDGRLAFVIGIAAMSACMFLAWRMSEAYGGTFGRILQESFIIIGWVVLWRPAEMVLYDWVPMARRRKLYRRLAAAKVSVDTARSA